MPFFSHSPVGWLPVSGLSAKVLATSSGEYCAGGSAAKTPEHEMKAATLTVKLKTLNFDIHQAPVFSIILKLRLPPMQAAAQAPARCADGRAWLGKAETLV
jgi:hypothetical protein